MEQLRSVSIRVDIDTNKDTYTMMTTEVDTPDEGADKVRQFIEQIFERF